MPTIKIDANVKELGDIPLRGKFIPVKDMAALSGAILYKKIGNQEDKVVAVSEFKPNSPKQHFPRNEHVLFVE